MSLSKPSSPRSSDGNKKFDPSDLKNMPNAVQELRYGKIMGRHSDKKDFYLHRCRACYYKMGIEHRKMRKESFLLHKLLVAAEWKKRRPTPMGGISPFMASVVEDYQARGLDQIDLGHLQEIRKNRAEKIFFYMKCRSLDCALLKYGFQKENIPKKELKILEEDPNLEAYFNTEPHNNLAELYGTVDYLTCLPPREDHKIFETLPEEEKWPADPFLTNPPSPFFEIDKELAPQLKYLEPPSPKRKRQTPRQLTKKQKPLEEEDEEDARAMKQKQLEEDAKARELKQKQLEEDARAMKRKQLEEDARALERELFDDGGIDEFRNEVPPRDELETAVSSIIPVSTTAPAVVSAAARPSVPRPSSEQLTAALSSIIESNIESNKLEEDLLMSADEDDDDDDDDDEDDEEVKKRCRDYSPVRAEKEEEEDLPVEIIPQGAVDLNLSKLVALEHHQAKMKIAEWDGLLGREVYFLYVQESRLTRDRTERWNERAQKFLRRRQNLLRVSRSQDVQQLARFITDREKAAASYTEKGGSLGRVPTFRLFQFLLKEKSEEALLHTAIFYEIVAKGREFEEMDQEIEKNPYVIAMCLSKMLKC